MRKTRAVWLCLGTVFLLLALWICFDAFGWRLFRFQHCSAPKSLQTELTVEENVCHITVSSSHLGSFSNSLYNGMFYTYQNGVLKIGIHEGFFGGSTVMEEEIEVDGEISNVILAGNGQEQELEFAGLTAWALAD